MEKVGYTDINQISYLHVILYLGEVSTFRIALLKSQGDSKTKQEVAWIPEGLQIPLKLFSFVNELMGTRGKWGGVDWVWMDIHTAIFKMYKQQGPTV